MQGFLRQQQQFKEANDFHKEKQVKEEMQKAKELISKYSCADTTCSSESEGEEKMEQLGGMLLNINPDKIPMGMEPDREYTYEELMKMDLWTRNWYHNFHIRKHFQS